MLQQWYDELLARFELAFAILDREYVMRVRRERGYGVNPCATHTRFLISHRLLIEEDYAAPSSRSHHRTSGAGCSRRCRHRLCR
jgi:hypothetical protein